MKKKDFSTGFGLFCGFAIIAISMIWGQPNPQKALSLFWDIPSIFITVLGSFCSVMISFPWSFVKNIPSVLKNAFLTKEQSQNDIINTFVELSKKARREGLLSLENEIENIDDRYMKTGIQMVVDGIEAETIKDIMELDIDETERRHEGSIQLFKVWASLAPAYGMLGTLIGLIQMLSNLQDETKLGSGLATALITSFYGSVLANLVFSPLASKLEVKSAEESNRKEMVLEGVLAVHSGVNPRIVEEKLKTFLSYEERAFYEENNIQSDTVNSNE